MNLRNSVAAPITGSINVSPNQATLVVHPCVIDSKKTLVYEKNLQQTNPGAHAKLLSFATANNFSVKEDQRTKAQAVVHDRRRMFLPMLVLGASLLFYNKQAMSAGFDSIFSPSTYSNVSGAIYQEPDILDAKTSAEMTSLLHWISSHSAYSFKGDELPKIMRVSSSRMARVAFGGNLPSNYNESEFTIYGLYNYEEKAVYLLNSIDLNSEQGRIVLLHELVHFLQYQHGVDRQVDSVNALEPQAYQLEELYITEHQYKAAG
ncbi:MAG: hypothetical protein V3R68_08125 [Gammaproteobacteria bacterium]